MIYKQMKWNGEAGNLQNSSIGCNNQDLRYKISTKLYLNKTTSVRCVKNNSKGLRKRPLKFLCIGLGLELGFELWRNWKKNLDLQKVSGSFHS